MVTPGAGALLCSGDLALPRCSALPDGVGRSDHRARSDAARADADEPRPQRRGRCHRLVVRRSAIDRLCPARSHRRHRHTQSALRFIIEGHGAYTAVDGERTAMEPGDFVITPSWTWHDHGNETSEPMVWLDGLDIQLREIAGRQFCPKKATRMTSSPSGRPEGDSFARYGHNLLPVDWKPEVSTSPVFNYPYVRTREALAALARNGAPDLSRLQIALREPGEWPIRDADDRATFVQLLPADFAEPTLPLDRRDGIRRCRREWGNAGRRHGLRMGTARHFCGAELVCGTTHLANRETVLFSFSGPSRAGEAGSVARSSRQHVMIMRGR